MNIKNSNDIGPADYYADTSDHTGSWYAIQATAAAVGNLVVSNWGGGATTSVAIPAGATIRGKFTSITLASGAVIAYRTL